MPGNLDGVSTKQQRIAMLAKRSPQMGFTSLAYLMDIDWLREAFYRTRKNGVPGVDGQTWAEYAENLEDKVLQRAVVMLLEPIYEQEFSDGSYGFRPGRSAHQALETLWKQTMNNGSVTVC